MSNQSTHTPVRKVHFPLNRRLIAAATAGLICLEGAAQAQTLQLRLPLSDSASSTTVVSDTTTNGGPINATLSIFNVAGTGQVNLHGAVGSGVNGGFTGLRALDFTPDLTASQTNQPANSALVLNATPGNSVVAADLGDSALAALGNSGVITNFVATMWIKMGAAMFAGSTIEPRMWILNAGTAGVDAGGSANTLGLKFQQNNQAAFQIGADNPTFLGTCPSGNFPVNKWLFFAIVYDGTNCSMYYGTDGAACQSIGSAATANRSINLGSSACLALGNRHSATANARGLNGWMNDFRFYNGAPTNALAFVENVRLLLAPKLPVLSGIYPDGTALMQATNTLTFTAASSSGFGFTNIDLVLNSVDVASSLHFVTNGTAGTATNVTATYTGLQAQTTNLAVITATDALGLAGTATIKFDTFSPTNFIVEAEEFDFGGGLFIPSPVDYTDGNPTDPNSYYGLDSVELIDTHKGVSSGDNTATDYRYSDGLGDRTQTPLATGELPSPKFANLVDASSIPITNHVVGNWSSAEWQNYTRVFPSGNYNVYARVSTASGSTIRLDQVTSGQGTSSQTTANLGSFTFSGSSLTSYQWVPLLKLGTLAVVNLGGTNTIRTTTGGGANADMYMLVPANTSVPLISGVYPDGQVLFEATNKLVFTVSSSVTTIATTNVHVSLNGVDVSASLVFVGGPSTWNVSYTGLQVNQTYATVINVTDANGRTATATLSIDTWNPVFQVEAEDFDFDPTQSPISNGTGHRYIDNAVPTGPHTVAANSYEDQIGITLIDEAGPNTANALTSQPGYSITNYRTNDYTATTLVTDTARSQFVSANALDYNIGFLGPNFWQQYTRTWPTGTFNVYGRMASGANIGTIHSSWQNIVAGWGSTNQVSRAVGTFNLPTTNGYSSYQYIPLIDKFGNYAQLTMGGTNTVRAVDLIDPGSFGMNINFYMLTAPRNDLPRIDSVYPNGFVLLQQTGTLSFVASSPTYGLSTSGVTVTLNGVNISSSLVFSGASPSYTVTYPGLQPNTSYSATISVTDSNAQTHTTTVNFDTFSASYFTWEAEDFDFGPENSPVANGSGLRYIDNPALTSAPATNSYYGQVGDQGIDESSIFFNVLGTYTYRSLDFVSTETTTDTVRQKYLDAQVAQVNPFITDYDVSHLTNAAWLNYTRTFPSGNYKVYARMSANAAFSVSLAQVTSGFGTMSQTVAPLGNFVGTNTSLATWQYVPLVNTNTGSPVVLSLGGVETLQVTGDSKEDVNFFMLVPSVPNRVTITAAIVGSNIQLSFPTQTGYTYAVQYKNNLSDPTWTQLGSPLSGNGSTQSVTDGDGLTQRFYRVSAH